MEAVLPPLGPHHWSLFFCCSRKSTQIVLAIFQTSSTSCHPTAVEKRLIIQAGIWTAERTFPPKRTPDITS
ncbi:hypothetical protein ILYODFUR_027383 [Ilyodon furcidens]|uniref:Secreted protein n=1 Tax=Ilyodon furcidens TaxID=33524 RepID=A0ABV0V8M0_9TELE